LRKYREFIDAEHSVHRENYEKMQQRLNKEGDAAPFTLSPQAVLKRVQYALESPRPKARYPVTVPGYTFSVLRRLLTTHQLDWLLSRASGSGSR